jgi:hypothetical protein
MKDDHGLDEVDVGTSHVMIGLWSALQMSVEATLALNAQLFFGGIACTRVSFLSFVRGKTWCA